MIFPSRVSSLALATCCFIALLFVAPVQAAATDSAPQAPSQQQQKHHGDEHDGEKHHAHGRSGGGGHALIHDFSDAERWSKIFDAEERDAWQLPEHVVQDVMAVRPGMTVADIGAGTGYFLPALSAAVGEAGRVLGLDPETTLVSFMQQRIAEEKLGNAEAAVIPYDDPGLEPGSVDRILIVNTWHHIEGREDYSRQLLKALAPDGAVYIVDFTLDSPKGPSASHRIVPEVVQRELAAGGLVPDTVDEDLPYQYIVVGHRPIGLAH
ncbi:MAG: methyltransferase [Acidobacteriota bacterium]